MMMNQIISHAHTHKKKLVLKSKPPENCPLFCLRQKKCNYDLVERRFDQLLHFYNNFFSEKNNPVIPIEFFLYFSIGFDESGKTSKKKGDDQDPKVLRHFLLKN